MTNLRILRLGNSLGLEVGESEKDMMMEADISKREILRICTAGFEDGAKECRSWTRPANRISPLFPQKNTAMPMA